MSNINKKYLKKKKKVTIEISNAELNRMEDYLVTQFKSDEEKENHRMTCLDIWAKLVKEFDKNES